MKWRKNNMDNINIIIFGATGDLTKKKLIPALFEIFTNDEPVEIIGFARRELSDDEFKNSFSNTGGNNEKWQEFLSSIHYHKGSFEDLSAFQSLRGQLQTDNLLFYLAVDPGSYETIVKNLQQSNLNPPQSRIIIEKPFGEDKQSAIDLYQTITEVFSEEQIYIIDHYLGKETVQNILAFRFANGLFEHIWNSEAVDSIQITSSETIGTEGRGGYYDKAGAMKDMIQSHILQILAATCMEPPSSFEPRDLHIARKKLFNALRIVRDEDTIRDTVVFGQYEGYKTEEKVDPHSHTETFAALKTYIDTDRWSGVPIYLRTGKKLAVHATEVFITFKKMNHHLFPHQEGNILAFRIQPNEGISLKLFVKNPGKEMEVQDVSMDFCYRDSFTISDNSYIRLLQDAIKNDRSLFTSIDEIVASWEFVAPYLAFKENHPELVIPYPPDQWGPEGSNALVVNEDRTWLSLYPYKCDINLTI